MSRKISKPMKKTPKLIKIGENGFAEGEKCPDCGKMTFARDDSLKYVVGSTVWFKCRSCGFKARKKSAAT